MKRIALALSGLLLVSMTSCNDASSKIASDSDSESTSVDVSSVDGEGSPKFSFSEEAFDFGTITEGDVAKHDFEFTNSGDAPLIITNAQGSCGCTVPEWPREPIAPGETGIIHVEFNSKGKPGNNQKEVTLSANTEPNTYVLKISAQVNKTAEDAAAQPTPEQVEG